MILALVCVLALVRFGNGRLESTALLGIAILLLLWRTSTQNNTAPGIRSGKHNTPGK